MRIRLDTLGVMVGSTLMFSSLTRGSCPRYEVTGMLPGPDSCSHGVISARGINDHGDVVGNVFCSLTGERPFLWRDGAFIDLGLPQFTNEGRAIGINDAGDIVGYTRTTQQRPFIFRDGAYTHLDGGATGAAYDVNSNGSIAGFVSGLFSGPSRASIWQDLKMQDLSAIIGDGSSSSVAINDFGHVVISHFRGVGITTTLLWHDDRFIDLGPIPGGVTSEPTNINNLGDVVGRGQELDDDGRTLPHRAYLWSDGNMELLDLFPGNGAEVPTDINDARQIVGYVATGFGAPFRPFLWQDGSAWNVNDLVDLPEGARIEYAVGINNAGQIIANGRTNGIDSFTVLLSPIPAEPSDLNDDCYTDGLDLQVLIEAWGRMDSPADLDEDGTVGFADLLLLMAAWRSSGR